MKTNEQYKPESVGIPNTLGGGRMPIHRTYDRKPLDACSVPGCLSTATVECEYKLANGKTCGHELCADHAGDAFEPMCPSHHRLVEQQKGKVRAWM